MSEPGLRVSRLGIVGVGLIGGSLARALKAAGAVDEVVGMARSRGSLERAIELGVIDRGETDAARVGSVDVLVIATPVRSIPAILRQFAPHVGAHTVITDAGSVKLPVCQAADILGPARARFVPGHPIAGTEHAGVEASFASLFEQRSVILTPDATVSPAAVETVSALWRAAGAEVLTMDAAEHDAILAATSHLPHMVAYTLVNCLARDPRHEALFRFAAGGFYDFTRIASSNPVMWRDIALANAAPLAASLRRFRSGLDDLIRALEGGDEEALFEAFQAAKQARDLGLTRKHGAS